MASKGGGKGKRVRRCNQGPKRFAAKVKAKEAVAQALELKTGGMHIRDIAVQLGRSTGWVSQAINKAVEEIPLESAKVYQAHIVARHEAIIASHWTKRAEPESAKVIQASLKHLVDVLGIEGTRRLKIELENNLLAVLDRVKAHCPPDVYEQVLAVVGGELGSGAAPNDPTLEGGGESEGEGD